MSSGQKSLSNKIIGQDFQIVNGRPAKIRVDKENFNGHKMSGQSENDWTELCPLVFEKHRFHAVTTMSDFTSNVHRLVTSVPDEDPVFYTNLFNFCSNVLL